MLVSVFFFFFQAEDGIRDVERSRGLGDVYKRQVSTQSTWDKNKALKSQREELELKLFETKEELDKKIKQLQRGMQEKEEAKEIKSKDILPIDLRKRVEIEDIFFHPIRGEIETSQIAYLQGSIKNDAF
eukprot:TRINITY_DN10666_c0_g1_i1.p4 TRINITY_DN10666_c0_g1~~TRINITY_DN10666_c0_g1_i1.p4  ORF type:complete len:129 (+),score=52.31 TRINITY_DN10666_c0_g1_i1:118-504(+)